MRLNDFQQRVDEKLETWIGNYGASAARQLGNRIKGDTEGEMTIAQKMGKDRFINDFVARAYATLNSEIQSGRVNPNPPAAPAGPQKLDPQAAAKLKGRLKAGQGLGKKTGAGFGNYVKGSGERFQGADATGAPVFKKIQRESRYDRLNAIFESLLTEAETVGQFFKRWLPTYMKRIDMSDPHTQELIQKIQDTYAQDKGKAALTQLANAAYAASYAPGYGAQAEPVAGQQPNSQLVKAVGSATNPKELAATIKAGLLKLNELDANAYKALVQELAKAASTPSPAMPTGVATK
jgi:hypothetical protein